MSKDDLCPTCPKPKWVAFAFESEGDEPGPKKMAKPGCLFHFEPSAKNDGGKEEIRPFDSVAWSGPGGEGQKEPKTPRQFKTMDETVQIHLSASPGYISMKSGVK